MSDDTTLNRILDADGFAGALFAYVNAICLGDPEAAAAGSDVLMQHDAAIRKALEYETQSATHHMHRAGFDGEEIKALRGEVERLTAERDAERARADKPWRVNEPLLQKWQKAIDDAEAEVERLRTERDEFEDDLLLCLQVRNLALEEAALGIQTGPDGQDYLDRSRMIRGWLTAAYDRHADGEHAHQLTDGPAVERDSNIGRRAHEAEAEVARLTRERENVQWLLDDAINTRMHWYVTATQQLELSQYHEDRAEAAEARVAVLTEALREWLDAAEVLATVDRSGFIDAQIRVSSARLAARAVLGGTETP